MSDPIIHMFAPLATPALRTRLVKQLDVMAARGEQVAFYGWERETGEAEAKRVPRETVREQVMMRGGGSGSLKTWLRYPLWSMRVFFKTLFLPRDAVIFALGAESAIPALMASLGSRRRVIFDDADRLSMIVSFPGPLHKMVEWFERWASRRAFRHLVPTRSRYDWEAGSMVQLRNTPNRADYDAAIEQGGQLASASPFVLYANGWVGETRGAPPLLEALEALRERGTNVKLRLIGRGDGAAFEALREHPLVDFSPVVPQVEALAAYKDADLLLTYYDPQIPINRYAESNKWGDAIFLGTPFVVNEEVVTARQFVEGGAAFALPYAKGIALADLVEQLAQDPERLECAKQRLADFRADFEPFDTAFARILRDVRTSG